MAQSELVFGSYIENNDFACPGAPQEFFTANWFSAVTIMKVVADDALDFGHISLGNPA